jgi:hypothetical protein
MNDKDLIITNGVKPGTITNGDDDDLDGDWPPGTNDGGTQAGPVIPPNPVADTDPRPYGGGDPDGP